MIKIYSLLLLLVFSSAVQAQINKNSILLGGQLGYSSSTFGFAGTDSSQEKSKDANIAISFGYAFKENKVVGINVGFSPSKVISNNYNPSMRITKTNGYSLGAFYRQYKPLGKGFYFFGEADAGVSSIKQTNELKSTGFEATTRQRGASLSLTPGLSYQVLRKLQLEISLSSLVGVSYTIAKYETNDPQQKIRNSTAFGFSSSLSNNNSLGYLGIGFRLIL